MQQRLFLIAAIALGSSFGCASGGDTGRPPGRTDGSIADGAVDGGDAAPIGCASDSDCTDDGVFCNGTPSCRGGVCVPGPAQTCEDAVMCTRDACLMATDACQHTPDDGLCPARTICVVGGGCQAPPGCEFDSDCSTDGVYCNGDEVCVAAMCMSPGMRNCADMNNCTADECVESAMRCMNTPYDHSTDVMHCGPTGMNDCVACPAPEVDRVHVTAACTTGVCGFLCDMGFGDADRNPRNGCECEIGAGTDDPDGMFLDSDCDGIDGDKERGILVSTSAGNDTMTCGLDFPTPCRTIAFGSTRAVVEGRRDLFIMAGTYSEVVSLRDGQRLFGGYDASWVRASRVMNRTIIAGGLDTRDNQYMSIRAHDLTIGATVENMVIVGPAATGTMMMTGAGNSSYAVHASNTTGLELIRVTIQGGNGADGASGMTGLDATSTAATGGMNGSMGGNANEFATACDTSSRGASGPAGSNSCPGGSATNGGPGGAGGTMDTSCGIFGTCSNCDATPGAGGGSGAQSGGGFGGGGGGGAGQSTCGPAGPGGPGRESNGAAGTGAASGRGLLVSGYWYGRAGGAGATGDNGGGGGGGGGSGGCDVGTDSYGAGGGGGGAGGCAARGGGGGGGAGGGSFGVLAVSSTISISDCDVQRGAGGAGGAGGTGGRGQSPGGPGPGGLASGDSAAGGVGAAGGHGGHGGGGGGGAGGASFGIFSLGSTIMETCTYSGGSAGSAGAGGPSAPTAPVAERDGNNGTPGVVGATGNTGTCAAAGGC